jgi:transcriptional regulator with XRE-family HTH domain
MTKQQYPLDDHIGLSIRERRLELGWTMKYFARKIKKTHGFVDKIERCERILSVGELEFVCLILNTTTECIIAKSRLHSFGIKL